jgi:hypothetical protein
MSKAKPSVKMTVSYEHILTAVEGYLKSMSMIDDDASVTEVYSSRDPNAFVIVTDKEKE